MAEKQLNGRVVLKNDTAENWAKATGFIPKKGEVIIYNTDSDNAFPRIKVGNGSSVVSSLPFIYEPISKDDIDEICSQTITAASLVTF